MAKIRMSAVWDRTTEVLSGRAGALAGIAAVTLLLPLVVVLAWTTMAVQSPSAAIVTLILLLGVAFVGVVGVLAMLALASDPATSRADAWGQARRRALPVIGVTALLVLLAFVAFLPLAIVLFQAHVDLAKLAATGTPPVLSGGLKLFLAIYYVAFMIFVLWATARLTVLNAVVLHERRGVGAIRRAFALTRGVTWRVIGVLLLYLVVLFIVRTAAQSVVGVILRLLLGPTQIGTAVFLAGLVGTAITTAFSVVAVAFTAQLYVALAAAGQPTDR